MAFLNLNYVLVFILFKIVHNVCGQFYGSPCPDVFDYSSDGNGVIRLRPSGPMSLVQIKVNYTIAARLMSNYVGRIEPVGNSLTLLQDFNNGAPIEYRIQFPVTSPLPKITSISANENMLCLGPGDAPGPHQYVTTASLQHTLFLKNPGNSGGFFNNFDQPNNFNNRPFENRPNFGNRPSKPSTDMIVEYFGQIPNDAQVFTFGDEDRHQVTYPVQERPHQSPVAPMQPDQSGISYFPEMTQPPSAQPPPRPVQRPQQLPTTPPRQPATPPRQPATDSGSSQCGVISGGNERQPLIFNGQGYSRGEWPWLVAIYKRKDGSLTFICSGTLVSDLHVVTAAHCMRQKNKISSQRDIVVKVGVHNLEDWGDDITVTRTISFATIHEAYNASSLSNDIMVLTLERNVEFNTNIRAACLWNGNPDQSRIVGASGVVAGWGQNEVGPAGRGEPHVVRMPVVSTAVCRASRPDFHKLTSENTFCAGDRNGSGPCLGDSGGGMYLLEGGRWRLRGVVSLSLRPEAGDSTCNLNEYIVFTDSAQYFDWIRQAMGNR